MLTDLRIRIRRFIRENKWKVVLIIIVWIILIGINVMLINFKLGDTLVTSYEPYTPIIDNGQTMPKKWQETIENKIEEYINYCNQKEYEKAYQMISEECRKEVYPTLDDFKAYVDYVFSYKKVYTIQNYSNRDKVYIYRIRLFEDILATGMTFTEDLSYFEEKLVFTEKKRNIADGCEILYWR